MDFIQANPHPDHGWRRSERPSGHRKHVIRRVRLALVGVAGFIALILTFIHTYSTSYNSLHNRQNCWDVPRSAVGGWSWRTDLPDNTELLKLQSKLNEVISQTSDFVDVRDRTRACFQELTELYVQTVELALSDRADLKDVHERLWPLSISLTGLELDLLNWVPRKLLNENRLAMKALQSAAGPRPSSGTNPLLRTLNRIYEVTAPGYAMRYGMALSESVDVLSLLSLLRAAISDGKTANDIAQQLEDIVGPVQRWFEDENGRRADHNAKRKKYLAYFKWLLPYRAHSHIYESMTRELFELRGLSNLSRSLRQIRDILPKLVQKLTMIVIDLENLEEHSAAVQRCSGVDAHVEEHRLLLETVIQGAQDNVAVYESRQS